MSHPTRLIVDLGAIRHNVRVLRECAGAGVGVMAVVKANAYGHGTAPVAKTALQAGAAWCGVSCVSEGIALREAGITAPVLVMGFTPASLARDAIQHDLRVNLFDIHVARAFSKAAVEMQQPCRAHVKIDTGMGRLGPLPCEAGAVIDAISVLPGIEIEGLFTHLSSAESDPDFSREQIRLFRDVARGRDVKWLHACNSAGAMMYAEGRFNLVRPGLAVYGMSPFAPSPPLPEASAVVAQLQPALRWVSRIVFIKTLPDGHGVGYNARYRCEGERRIAVIPVGYGDGFRRTPRNAGEVLVRGQRAPIRGNVCMDQCMIDVTDIPEAQFDDEVVLLGAQGNDCITADEIAQRIGTVNYEVTTELTDRPARVYVNEMA
jgi:alanine racemase